MFCATQCFSSDEQLKFGSVVNKPKPDLYEFFVQILWHFSLGFCAGCSGTWRWDSIKHLNIALSGALGVSTDFFYYLKLDGSIGKSLGPVH